VNILLKIIKAIFSIIGIALAGYGLATKNFEFMPFMMFSLGVTMLMEGLMEHKRKPRSFWAYMYIATSLFGFFVSIQGFLLN